MESVYPLKIRIEEVLTNEEKGDIDVFFEEQKMSRFNYFEFMNLKNKKYEITVFADELNQPILRETVDLTDTVAGVKDLGVLLVDKEGMEGGMNSGSGFSFGPILIVTLFVYLLGKDRIDEMIYSKFRK